MQSSNIVNFSEGDSFDKVVLQSKEPVVVDFYADWCGPCKKLTPIIEEALRNEKNFKLVKVNVDNNQTAAEEYKVSAIPHIFLFHEGKNIFEFKGASQDKVNEMVELIKKVAKPKAFSGSGITLGSDSTITLNSNLNELDQAKLASLLSDEPTEGSDTYNIIFKYGDETFKRRFLGTDSISQLKSYIQIQLKTSQGVELFEPFPRKIYSDDSALVNSSGLSKNQILMVKVL
jgi:thioredoxin 1